MEMAGVKTQHAQTFQQNGIAQRSFEAGGQRGGAMVMGGEGLSWTEAPGVSDWCCCHVNSITMLMLT
ncbi:hypothetical protein DPMN_151575 [Dreissena polymorpha]|uniref:Uncharacterized protein n=1 Tax=Dreissena polymorpha TaxID=45954 RepID=A0A9D4FK83_DREPO|nr:hypothetical protein DPMN_151575 [Dreissena polymorpha]